MKFCTHCGAEKFKTSRFCRECGAPHPYEEETKPKRRRRKVEEEAAPAIEEFDEDDDDYEKDTREGIGNGWIFLAVFLLLIVILGSCSK